MFRLSGGALLLVLSVLRVHHGFSFSQGGSHRQIWCSTKSQRHSIRIMSSVEEFEREEGVQSELPNDFVDAVQRASDSTVRSIKMGTKRVRIDFDTSVGDMTYTSIKNTMPMLKELVNMLSRSMELSIPPSYIIANSVKEDVEEDKDEKEEEKEEEEKEKEKEKESEPATQNAENESADIVAQTINVDAGFELTRTLRIFFPDMGAAALSRRDWKMVGEVRDKKAGDITLIPEVPPCVTSANVQNDGMANTDQLAIILCPQYSEADYIKRIIGLCDIQDIPCILINPALINGDQGFGVRARNVRKDILDTFLMTYKLRTLKEGALVREWPGVFTLWKEDALVQDGGYKTLGSFAGKEPTREEMDDLFDLDDNPDLANKNVADNIVVAGFNEISGFFKGMSKL